MRTQLIVSLVLVREQGVIKYEPPEDLCVGIPLQREQFIDVREVAKVGN